MIKLKAFPLVSYPFLFNFLASSLSRFVDGGELGLDVSFDASRKPRRDGVEVKLELIEIRICNTELLFGNDLPDSYHILFGQSTHILCER